jgi:hypothetical protein
MISRSCSDLVSLLSSSSGSDSSYRPDCPSKIASSSLVLFTTPTNTRSWMRHPSQAFYVISKNARRAVSVSSTCLERKYDLKWSCVVFVARVRLLCRRLQMSRKANSTTILSMTSFGQPSRLGDMMQDGGKTEAKVRASASVVKGRW